MLNLFVFSLILVVNFKHSKFYTSQLSKSFRWQDKQLCFVTCHCSMKSSNKQASWNNLEASQISYWNEEQKYKIVQYSWNFVVSFLMYPMMLSKWPHPLRIERMTSGHERRSTWYRTQTACNPDQWGNYAKRFIAIFHADHSANGEQRPDQDCLELVGEESS